MMDPYDSRVLRQLVQHTGTVGASGFAKRFSELYVAGFTSAKIGEVRVSQAETKRRLAAMEEQGLVRSTPGTPYLVLTYDGFKAFMRLNPEQRRYMKYPVMELEDYYGHEAEIDGGARLRFRIFLPDHPDKPGLYAADETFAEATAKTWHERTGMRTEVWAQDEEANRLRYSFPPVYA